MPQTYEPISTTILGSTTATVTLSSIPQTYTDLIIVASAQAAVTGDDFVVMYFNGDTASNYCTTQLYTYNGSTALSSRTSSTTGIFAMPLPIYTSNEKDTSFAHIMNYANTTTFKSVLCRDNSLRSGLNNGIGVGTWRSTAAITSVSMRTINGYGWASGSVITLFGIKAA